MSVQISSRNAPTLVPRVPMTAAAFSELEAEIGQLTTSILEARTAVLEAEPPLELASSRRGGRLSALLSGLAMVAGGALVGLAVSVILLWDRIAAMLNLSP